MNAASKTLQNLIEECDSKISELHRQIRELEAQKRGYQVVVRTIEDDELLRQQLDMRRGLESEYAPRGISETWRKILAFIGERGPTGATIDQIESFIAINSLEITRNNLRSQLSIYTSRLLLERVAFSTYRLSDAGRQFLGLTLVKPPAPESKISQD